ncbi:MAG: PD40 domain-containing protein [Nitrospirae bacterium]|nr:PD40 domain-containing protein [Nitrospirota bacterium]
MCLNRVRMACSMALVGLSMSGLLGMAGHGAEEPISIVGSIPFPRDQKIFYLHRPAKKGHLVYVMRPDGSQKTPLLKGLIEQFAVSTDGRRIVLTVKGRKLFTTETWIYEQGILRLLLRGDHYDGDFSWSHDGQMIVFVRKPVLDGEDGKTVPGVSNIWVMRGDGSAPRQITFFQTGDRKGVLSPSFTPDGLRIRYGMVDLNSEAIRLEYRTMDLKGKDHQLLFRDKEYGVWSPDGQWIIFKQPSNNTTRSMNVVDLYLADNQGRILRRLTTTGNVGSVNWSPDGKWVVYDKFNPMVLSEEQRKRWEEGTAGMVLIPGGSDIPSRDLWKLPVWEKESPIRLTSKPDRSSLGYWTR